MTALLMPNVAPEIFDLRPDYSAVSVIADGLENATDHPAVDRLVREVVSQRAMPSWAEEHLKAWQLTFQAFGAKPQRTPCSAEALMKRVQKEGQLPVINAVVDLYNAVSVRYAIPIGGENIAAYVSHPRLSRATGTQSFDTMKDGEPFTELVPTGEVVWADEQGVTCRRWNWRQGSRTRIDLETSQAWFVLERLDPMPLTAVVEAANLMKDVLRRISPGVHLSVCHIDRIGATDVSCP